MFRSSRHDPGVVSVVRFTSHYEVPSCVVDGVNPKPEGVGGGVVKGPYLHVLSKDPSGDPVVDGPGDWYQ